jgi:hypothetical protein
MGKYIFWLYMINAVLLIVHEIDSAYWEEWEIFRLPGKLAGFLILHVPLLFLVLYGLVLIDRGNPIGRWFALVLAISGVFAFSIHTWFLAKGRPEFNAPISKFILWTTLGVSIALGVVATM